MCEIMQISKIKPVGINQYTRPIFRQEPTEKDFSATEKFISDTNLLYEKNSKGNWFTRNFRSTTASIIACSLILAYETIALIKAKKIKNPEEKKELAQKFLIGLLPVSLASLGAFFGVQKLIEKDSEKYQEKNEELFNKINKTNAKYNKKTISSGTIGAMYDVASGDVTVNNTFTNDPIGRLSIKKLLKHELEHARQFELIASLDDGIERMNHAFIKNFYVVMKKNPEAVKEILIMEDELKKDVEGKYNDIKIKIGNTYSEGISAKKFIIALKMMHDDENIDYKKLPMLINKEHYEEAIKNRGKLTEAETKEAEAYLDAYSNYPNMNFWQVINPLSKYKTNPLEKGARKASRRKD